MHSDDRRRVQDKRTLGDLSWVHWRVVHCAVLLHFVGDQVVLAIKEEDAELFSLFVAHGGLTVVD